MLPDFIIVGAQKAGTSSLFRYLMDLEGTTEPVKKELHFFDFNFGLGLDWYRDQFPAPDPSSRLDPPVTGEASPYYVFHPLALERMRDLLPDVKVIVSVRDPRDRAVSHYWHEVRLGKEDLGLLEALEAEPARLAGEEDRILSDPGYRSFAHQHHSYLARGRYGPQLHRLFALFAREQVHVVRFEALVESPATTLAGVRRFLGLGPATAGPLPVLNVGRYDEVERGVATLLDATFAGWKEELAELVGPPAGPP